MRRLRLAAAALGLLALSLAALSALTELGPSLSPPVQAAGEQFPLNMKVVTGDEQVISEQIITDVSSATTLTVPSRTRYAVIQAQLANVRYRWGTAPTAGAGGILYEGSLLIVNASIDDLQLIDETAGATVYVVYVR